MIKFALKGLFTRKLRTGLDRARDRARRRDDQRDVRPHGLDRQRVRQDLHGRPSGLGRRRSPASPRSTSRTAAASRSRRSTSRSSARCARSRRSGRPREASTATRRQLIGKDGKAIVYGGAPNLGFASPTATRRSTRSGSSRALAGAGRDRHRQGDGRQEGLRDRRRDRRPGGRARSSASGSPGSWSSARPLDRRRDARRLRPPDGAASCSRRRAARRDRGRREAGRTPQQLLAAIRPILPPDAQVRTGAGAGAGGRGGHERVHLVPAGVPARVRRDRAVRRLVRDRELALDHDRAADARVRDAADARRIAASGARARSSSRRSSSASSRRWSASSSVSCSRPGSSSSSRPSASRCRTTGSSSSTRTVVVALLAGILVTLFASLRPALRATRVPPIAAVREGATLPPGRFARYRGIGAALTASPASRRSPTASSATASARSRSSSGWASGAAHVPRRRALLVAARPSARQRARLARGADRRRGRPARARQRSAQPAAHRVDRGRADDRARARHARRHARRGHHQRRSGAR